MPFEAAKAVAATFCWRIRYALTPLFGHDFPSMCLPPQGAQFGKMIIDPAIVRRATESANYYRMLELQSKLSSSSTTATTTTSHLGRPTLSRVSTAAITVYNPPKKKVLSRSQNRRLEADKKSVDDTDSEGSDSYCIPPPTPSLNCFTAINSPRSSQGTKTVGARTVIHRCNNLLSPQEILTSICGVKRPSSRMELTAREPEEDGEDSSDSELSSTSTSFFSKASGGTASGMDLVTESDRMDENMSNDESGDHHYNDDDDKEEYTDDENASTTTSTTTTTVSYPLSSSSTISPPVSVDSSSLSSASDDERITRRKKARARTRTRTSKITRKKTTGAPNVLLSCEVKAAHALLSLHTHKQQQQQSNRVVDGDRIIKNSLICPGKDDDNDNQHVGRKRRRRASA